MNADSILFSWLLDSMKPDIVELFRHEKICKIILDIVNSNFSKKEEDAMDLKFNASSIGRRAHYLNL